MLKKIFEFLKKIFVKNSQLKELENGREIRYSKYKEEQGFRSKMKFDNGKEYKNEIKEILGRNEEGDNQEEIKEKLLLYIDSLIDKVDKCQKDIAICKANIRNMKS